ncbi:hypothetical protein BGW36DRAFT_419409 [Talaromyces proteolyticus]|uniref:RING-type domain-containing protein n=1 Tax=Talaromyces proteolyticus TaxID=1131652 RepID=A0AAD4PST6_9EURO|nr:uncharacterized protein BGW36DRAFT_419409 [Talaromyces proteolyticus]KAH8692021.1 hypothetical protein BGW36DRAFT_419409 [Talaromyces proteolyticus]
MSDAFAFMEDEDTVSLAIQLQMEDISDTESGNKGKIREDDVCDADVARRIYMDELKNLESIVTDRRISRSMASAVISDGPLSSKHSGRKSLEVHVRCDVCHESNLFFDVTQVPCSHSYCTECLGQLFNASLVYESLFPPRYCRKSILIEPIRFFLDSELNEKFVRRKTELETPNRTYCYQPSCSSWIGPKKIVGDLCTCQSHDGDCPQEPAIKELHDLAKSNGWQECHNCHRIVELGMGCIHIICRCGAEFCYQCGDRGKTCQCPQWEKANLLDRAINIANRANRGNVQANGQANAEQIEIAVGHLREHHDCQYTVWRSVRGPHRCEECRDHLANFIYLCQECGTQACRRCRLNRM